ncbi:hypothetical protein M1116_00105 [Patescibacteria group bacterium]|nr:hypothetical protein [Patescibacteria group bacterium]
MILTVLAKNMLKDALSDTIQILLVVAMIYFGLKNPEYRLFYGLAFLVIAFLSKYESNDMVKYVEWGASILGLVLYYIFLLQLVRLPVAIPPNFNPAWVIGILFAFYQLVQLVEMAGNNHNEVQQLQDQLDKIDEQANQIAKEIRARGGIPRRR